MEDEQETLQSIEEGQETLQPMEEEVQEQQERSVSKLPIRLLFFLISDALNIFGGEIMQSVGYIFLISKLGLLLEDWMYLSSLFLCISCFLYPITGFFADMIYNKFYLIVCRDILSGISNFNYILLCIPTFRSSARVVWSICYVIQTIGTLADVLGKPSYKAFVIEQFHLPEEQVILRKFLQWSIILDEVLSLLAALASPLLKSHLSCFGEQECYMASFLLGFIVMLASYVTLIAGYRFYIIKRPEVRSVKKAIPCIIQGLKGSIRNRNTDPKEHWLDHAEPAYGAELVEEVKAMFRILLFSISVPILVAVDTHDDTIDYNGMIRLKLRVGGYKILPEHVDLAPRLLKLIIVPLLMRYVEPRLKGTRLDRPYRWILFGAVLLATTQFFFGILLSNIIKNLPEEPDVNEAQIRIYNGAECPAVIKATKYLNETLVLDAYGQFTDKHVPALAYETCQLTVSGSCFDTVRANLFLEGGNAISVFIKKTNDQIDVSIYIPIIANSFDSILPVVCVMGAEAIDSLFIEDTKGVIVDLLPELDTLAGQSKVMPGPRVADVTAEWYNLYWNGRKIMEFETDFGGIYHISLFGKTAKLSIIAPPNAVHVLWLVPIKAGDVIANYFLKIGEAEFLYMEMPPALRGTADALLTILEGVGYGIVPLLETDWQYDSRMYFYAILNLMSYLFPLIFILRMRSRHPGRKLV